jgi:hypothetical protein
VRSEDLNFDDLTDKQKELLFWMGTSNILVDLEDVEKMGFEGAFEYMYRFIEKPHQRIDITYSDVQCLWEKGFIELDVEFDDEDFALWRLDFTVQQYLWTLFAL